MAKTLPSRKKIVTVWLEGEVTREGRDKQRLFKCFNCGYHLAHYVGTVDSIVVGGAPYNPRSIVKCAGVVKNDDGSFEECNTSYTFMDVATHVPGSDVE